jgi:hypothetical protein
MFIIDSILQHQGDVHGAASLCVLDQTHRTVLLILLVKLANEGASSPIVEMIPVSPYISVHVS